MLNGGLTMGTTRAATLEIPKDRWRSYLDGFSQIYQGWRTTIEAVGIPLGDQVIATDAPLQGISYDTAGTGAGNIEIGVGDRPDKFATHVVERPQRLWVADVKPGEDMAMEIEAADGIRHLIDLRTIVDRLLPPKG